MIKKSTEESFSEYDDKKAFFASLDKQYKELKQIIDDFKDKDRGKKNALPSCTLNKIYYYFPKIDLLPTLESSSSSSSAKESQSLSINSSFMSQDIDLEDNIKDRMKEKVMMMMQAKKSNIDLMY